jgi:delta-aminolevulinic acid dehydratase/porphobilinogen synthase
MGSDFWIGTETDHLWPSMPERVVFEDTRHLNEAEAIDRMGGRIVEIFRPGLIPKDHRTEYAQRAINAHHIVRNCTGDLADTYEQIDKIVRMMVGRSERMSAL